MADTTAHVISLRRYVSLLRQEERRLKWVNTSPLGTSVQRASATADIDTITGKLHNAEKELARLEVGRRR